MTPSIPTVRGRGASLSAAGAVLLGVAGCRAPLEPLEDGLSVDVPATYTDAPEEAEVPSGPWWRSALDDDTLDALMARCLERNYELQQAVQVLRQANASARAAGAPLLPSVDLGASVQNLEIRDDTGSGANIPVRQGNTYGLGPSLSWELDLFGRIDATRDAAVFQALASEADVAATRLALTGSVLEAYLDTVENAALRDVVRAQIATNEQLLDLARTQFANGSGTALAILQQERALEATRAELPTIEGTLERAANQLAVLVGESPQAFTFDAGTAIPELAPLPGLDVPSALFERRPDLVAELHRVRGLDRSVAAAVTARYPRLSLSASYNFDASHLTDLFDRTIRTLVGNLTMPLMDGCALRAEAERARAELAGGLAALQQTFLVALQEVEDALSLERRGVELRETLERQLEIGRQEIDQARRDFIGGRATYLPVLQALTSLQAIERQLVSQRVTVLRARAQLLRALGGATEDPQAAAEARP